MAEQHRATDLQWIRIKARTSDNVAYSTILELLHRIEVLEAAELRGEVNEAELQQARDQELDACCDWLRTTFGYGVDLDLKLRAARRPKPSSLKEQALADFDWLVGRTLGRPETDERSERIRRALEQLND